MDRICEQEFWHIIAVGREVKQEEIGEDMPLVAEMVTKHNNLYFVHQTEDGKYLYYVKRLGKDWTWSF